MRGRRDRKRMTFINMNFEFYVIKIQSIQRMLKKKLTFSLILDGIKLKKIHCARLIQKQFRKNVFKAEIIK